MGANKNTPHYPLAYLLGEIAKNNYKVTTSALRDAANYYDFDLKAVVTNTLRLDKDGTFHKSMESDNDPEIWQDAYRLTMPEHPKLTPAYNKLSVHINSPQDQVAKIVSFKPKKLPLLPSGTGK